MITYCARLDGSRLVLWCYLAWYVAVVCLYFEAAPRLWISAGAVSVAVGIALNLAARRPNQKTDGWVVFRLFLIPFCVSSYSDLMKGNGFVLLFPSDPSRLLVCVLSCLGVLAIHFLCRLMMTPGGSPTKPTKS